MKIINITNGFFAALLLANGVASAESQYPASDFQPKVLYQDTEYKHQGASASAGSTSSKPADSQYPAADFQPKVVFSDSNYKHSSSAPTASAQSSNESASNSESASGSEAKKEESNFVYLIGLAVLGFVGFVFFKNQAQPDGASSHQSAASRVVGGATGVAKYLNRKAGTGVSRYLESQIKAAASTSPLTGVAKYMAGQSTNSPAENKPASRVEKYLRDRG